MMCPQGAKKCSVWVQAAAPHQVHVDVIMCEDSFKNLITWMNKLLACGLDYCSPLTTLFLQHDILWCRVNTYSTDRRNDCSISLIPIFIPVWLIFVGVLTILSKNDNYNYCRERFHFFLLFFLIKAKSGELAADLQFSLWVTVMGHTEYCMCSCANAH